MLTKQDIFQKIIDNKETIKSFGVTQIGLFGSYVRNEQTESSDIDILVDYDVDKISYVKYFNFCEFIESIFKNNKIDIVTKNGLSRYIGPHILKEVDYVKIWRNRIYRSYFWRVKICNKHNQFFNIWTFFEDEVIKRAVVRALEIVGEATKNLSIDFRLKYNQVPWKFMAGMRDKLIHDYMGVDYRLVFKTAKEDVPELFDYIELIVKEHTNK